MAKAQNRTLDAALLLEDGAAPITATATGSEGILDLNNGANVPATVAEEAERKGELLLHVSALDLVTGDEAYDVLLQGSNDSGFASGIVNLLEFKLGPAAVLIGGADVASAIGPQRRPFSTMIEGVSYRYVRLRFVIAGTTPSITLDAYLGKVA